MSDNRTFAIRANFFVLGIARNWLRIALVILGIYVTLPFVAPTMMKIGAEGVGRAIYTMYTPFCHQFGFRSFFLYGEQAVYPRYNVPDIGVQPYESFIGDEAVFEGVDIYGFDADLIFAAREFAGNEQMGYKLTLCERDIFIYLAIFTGGLIYSIPRVRRRLRPVPLWLYAILGLGPIGLDGFSQLLSYPPFELWPIRETYPLFRVLTGALFGIMTAWLGFPYLEESFDQTRRVVESKLRRAGIDHN